MNMKRQEKCTAMEWHVKMSKLDKRYHQISLREFCGDVEYGKSDYVEKRWWLVGPDRVRFMVLRAGGTGGRKCVTWLYFSCWIERMEEETHGAAFQTVFRI